MHFNTVLRRFEENTLSVRPGYQYWDDTTRRIRVPTGDPGAVGSIHIFEVGDQLRGIVYHPATYNCMYDPHLHAVMPMEPFSSAQKWAKALAGFIPNMSDSYRSIPAHSNGDAHIWP